MARLFERYNAEIIGKMRERFGYKNRLAVPRIEKICINMGVGKSVGDNNPKLLEEAVKDLTIISGQRAVTTKAKVSVSSFKLREGNNVGCRVTLRGKRMYEFLDRLINIAVPRIKDFRGLSPHSFDGRGNYSLGISEQMVFPEIDANKVTHIQGMDVAIVIKNSSDEKSRELLRMFGMPFREN